MCGELHPEKAAIPEHARRSDDSPIRATAIRIYGMRGLGLSDTEIAAALGLSVKTIPGYIYKAGKNGWLDFDDPKEALENQVLHKVVRNLDEMLDSPDEETKKEVTLKVYEGSLSKKVQEQGQGPQAQAVVGVKIEIVGGERPTVREGTIMGTGTYIDAESVPVE
jgi:DNA-binding CsgD family transcriptional regulator